MFVPIMVSQGSYSFSAIFDPMMIRGIPSSPSAMVNPLPFDKGMFATFK